MRLSTVIRLGALVILLGLVAYATPAQDPSTDDVAAAARKAREKQKNEPPPKKVLTNDDIPSAKTGTPASQPAGPKTEGQQDAGQGKDAAEDDPKSEAHWRKRSTKLRGQLDTAQKELDVLQRELEKDQTQYYPDPQKALMQQYSRSDINDKTAKIDAKKKEIESLKQQISDMEDDVRKAGGDPGWVR